MQDGYLIGKLLSEEKEPEEAFKKLFKLRSKETANIIKGSQLSAKIRAGTEWYSQAARKLMRIMVTYAPGMIRNQIAKGFTPSYADEKFMTEVRAQYKK